MAELVDLFFTRCNLFLPILHRPTFEQGIASGLHRENPGFGGTVLLACAIASRYSSDPRVFLAEANSEHSAGWKWFDQVLMVPQSRLAPPSLYDLQKYCVSDRSYLNLHILICILVGRCILAWFVSASGVLDDGRGWYSHGARRRRP